MTPPNPHPPTKEQEARKRALALIVDLINEWPIYDAPEALPVTAKEVPAHDHQNK